MRNLATTSILIAALSCLPAALVSAADPTRPLGYTPSSTVGKSGLVLNSILISARRKVAVINDRLVHEGESIAGAKVISISAKQIQIQRNGKRRIIKLNPTTVKRATGHDRK